MCAFGPQRVSDSYAPRDTRMTILMPVRGIQIKAQEKKEGELAN